MAEELLSSKIAIEEEEPKVRSIPAAPTSVAGAVGITERGPIGQAVLCTSFEEYQQTFGGFTLNSDLSLAAMGLFGNGGSQLWVVRTVHFTNVDDPTTATALKGTGSLTTAGGPAAARVSSLATGPLVLADGAALVVSVSGGADQTATFHAAPAAVTSPAAGPFVLADGQTLIFQIDRGPAQTVAFLAAAFVNIAAATPAEVAAAINPQIFGGKAALAAGQLVLASDTLGLASAIQVTGGTAAAALGFPANPVGGTGNVASARAVTLAEAKAVIEAAIPTVHVLPGTVGAFDLATTAQGPAVTLQVRPGTAAGFQLDTTVHRGSATAATPVVRVDGRDPGAYINRVEVDVLPPSSGAANTFNLAVLQGGVHRESFPNLSMDPTNARYLETIVNDPASGSVLVQVTDLVLPGPPIPGPQTLVLAGGDDGLTGLTDADFLGTAVGGTGLQALNTVQDLALLLVPGRATPAVHQGMIHYCETDRNGMVFAVLDPPEGMSAAAMVTYAVTTAQLVNRSEYAAIYWPRLLALNPNKAVFGSAVSVVVPPSGIVCGIYARNDAATLGGVYVAPAGIENGKMTGVVGFEMNEVLEEKKRDLVYPSRINPLTTGTGMPRYVDGSRTLKSDGNFPYVAERRGVIFIEKSLRQGLQFARHKNNTESLRAMVRRTTNAFLLTQMNNGAFRSRDPKTAFSIDVSDALNTAAVVFAGKLLMRVGLATNKPAEFILILISQDTRALDAQQANQTTGSTG